MDTITEKVISVPEKQIIIIELLSNGYTISEIAENLSLSPRTITSHIENLRKKFGAANSIHLVSHFLRNKMFE
jgi:DNA-binding NarL/FixJ family response regulator